MNRKEWMALKNKVKVPVESFELSYDNRFFTVKGEGVEASYLEVYREGSKEIKRCWAEVNGYKFGERDLHWKKNGRGGIKNKEAVEEMLRKADRYMIENGFFFTRNY